MTTRPGIRRSQEGAPPRAEGTPLAAAFQRAAVINAALLKLGALDLDDEETQRLRARIDAAIAALEAATSTLAIRLTEQRLADDVHHHMRAQANLLRAREAEFNQTVALLTEAVVQFRDTSGDFTGEVLERGERLRRIVAMEDLRAIRAGAAHEVAALRQAALARREADASHIAVLRARVDALETRLAVTIAQSSRDALTGLADRTAWDQRLAELELHLRAGHHGMALAMIDIDHFKQINDSHGHGAGDAVLAELAELCRQAFGADDFVARVGGDEFAVLMAAPALDHATGHVERLLDSVRRANTATAATGRPAFTVSVGLTPAGAADTAHSLVNRADRALYAAKQAGRDTLSVG